MYRDAVPKAIMDERKAIRAATPTSYPLPATRYPLPATRTATFTPTPTPYPKARRSAIVAREKRLAALEGSAGKRTHKAKSHRAMPGTPSSTVTGLGL